MGGNSCASLVLMPFALMLSIAVATLLYKALKSDSWVVARSGPPFEQHEITVRFGLRSFSMRVIFVRDPGRPLEEVPRPWHADNISLHEFSTALVAKRFADDYVGLSRELWSFHFQNRESSKDSPNVAEDGRHSTCGAVEEVGAEHRTPSREPVPHADAKPAQVEAAASAPEPSDIEFGGIMLGSELSVVEDMGKTADDRLRFAALLVVLGVAFTLLGMCLGICFTARKCKLLCMGCSGCLHVTAGVLAIHCLGRILGTWFAHLRTCVHEVVPVAVLVLQALSKAGCPIVGGTADVATSAALSLSAPWPSHVAILPCQAFWLCCCVGLGALISGILYLSFSLGPYELEAEASSGAEGDVQSEKPLEDESSTVPIQRRTSAVLRRNRRWAVRTLFVAVLTFIILLFAALFIVGRIAIDQGVKRALDGPSPRHLKPTSELASEQEDRTHRWKMRRKALRERTKDVRAAVFRGAIRTCIRADDCRKRLLFKANETLFRINQTARQAHRKWARQDDQD